MNLAQISRSVSLTLALALGSSAALAERVQPLTPPAGSKPGQGASVGTGQAQPTDPTDLPKLPPPVNKPCGLSGPHVLDQTNCEPDHGPNSQGQNPGNHPGDAWFSDMYLQIYQFQSSLTQLAQFGQSSNNFSLYYYATWLQSVTTQVGHAGFDISGQPLSYPGFGLMSRGDFNFYFYFWIRPLYWNLLYQAQSYVQTSGVTFQYQQVMTTVVTNYQSLTACMYGFNGNDPAALRDYEARAEEQAAGINIHN